MSGELEFGRLSTSTVSRMCSQATATAIGAFMDGTRRFVGFDLVFGKVVQNS